MPSYNHYQQLKTSVELPEHDEVGACLTCAYWEVTEYRDEAMAPKVALCLHPKLAPLALIVSGSSACNKWEAKPNKEPEAGAYAERGEEAKETQQKKAAHVAMAHS